MFDVAPVCIFADLVVFKIVEVHIHHDFIAGDIGLGKDIEHAADQLIVSSVKEVGVELGKAGKKGWAGVGGLGRGADG